MASEGRKTSLDISCDAECVQAPTATSPRQRGENYKSGTNSENKSSAIFTLERKSLVFCGMTFSHSAVCVLKQSTDEGKVSIREHMALTGRKQVGQNHMF